MFPFGGIRPREFIQLYNRPRMGDRHISTVLRDFMADAMISVANDARVPACRIKVKTSGARLLNKKSREALSAAVVDHQSQMRSLALPGLRQLLG